VEIDALIDFSKKNSGKDEDVEIVEKIEIPVRCLPGMVIIETDIISKRGHDAGRTTCKVLFSQTREVLRKYGEQGVFTKQFTVNGRFGKLLSEAKA